MDCPHVGGACGSGNSLANCEARCDSDAHGECNGFHFRASDGECCMKACADVANPTFGDQTGYDVYLLASSAAPVSMPTGSPTETLVCSLRPLGSCVAPDFEFIETVADCTAAARSITRARKQKRDTAQLPHVSNAANRNEVPYGCYFLPTNPGAYRSFFNLVGLTDATTDTEH